MSIGLMIAESAKLSLGYGQKLLAGVSADQFARFAPGESGLVTSNHGAFIYGHLSLYSPRVVEQLGGDVSSLAPSDKFVAVFDQSVQCVDDPDGTVYPSMDEITERLFTTQEAAIAALINASDEALMAPNENAMSDRFTTVGSMMNFYLGGHFMIHMGQMSAWRRMMGLGAA